MQQYYIIGSVATVRAVAEARGGKPDEIRKNAENYIYAACKARRKLVHECNGVTMKRTVAPVQRDRCGLRENDRRVLDVLEAAEGPLRAYELLDLLRCEGINGPPTVYRALARLTQSGLVHRIESMNAYIACRAPCSSSPPVLVICDHCGSTEELHEDIVVARLRRRARTLGIELDRIYLELRGRCARCGTASE